MNWYKASLNDVGLIQKCAVNNKVYANNYSSINSFLYEKKFDSRIAIDDDWLFEKYYENNQLVYTFPHNITGDFSSLKSAIEKMIKDAEESGGKCVLKNITAEEKLKIEKIFQKTESEAVRQSSDYIYLTKNLAELPGGTYSKKRNHVNQFIKKHENYYFELLNESNLTVPLMIENLWFEENTALQTDEDVKKSLLIEKDIISNALNNFGYFSKTCGMKGGILFVENTPVAFCLSSILSEDVTDIHFEKCLSPFAKDGGYAMINQQFAKTVETKYINREEDLGIEGLRKAKLSYYPEIILEKFNVVLF